MVFWGLVWFVGVLGGGEGRVGVCLFGFGFWFGFFSKSWTSSGRLLSLETK